MRSKTIIIRVLFVIYAATMIYLLFIHRLIYIGGDIASLAVPDYISALSDRLEPFPFRTISEFIGMIGSFSVSDLAFRNLAGNIILFVPIGIFLPAIFERQERFVRFLVTTVIIICSVELIQLFTLLGTCDVDDLILNTAGASTGFGIHTLFRKVRTGNKER